MGDVIGVGLFEPVLAGPWRSQRQRGAKMEPDKNPRYLPLKGEKMDGPAISRLRWHLEKARELVFAYYWQRNPEDLEMAEHRVAVAQEIYDVIKGETNENL